MLPALPAVRGLPQRVGGEVKNVRVDWRKNYGLGAQHAVIGCAERLGCDILRLIGAAIIP